MPRAFRRSVRRASAPSLALTRRAWPLGLFHLTQVLLGVTDLAVVGALGVDELAAVGLGRTWMFSYLAVGIAVLGAALVLLAETESAARRAEIVQGSIALAGVLLLGGLGLQAAVPDALRAVGHDPVVIGRFSDYTGTLVWMIGPAALYAVLKNVLAGAGTTALVAVSAALMVIGNLVASVVLVHGASGIEPMGVRGAAIATVAVNVVGAGVLWVGCRRRGLLVAGHGPTLRVIARRAGGIVRLGWASGVQQALESALFVAVLVALGTFSSAWVVAGALAFAVMEIDLVIGSAYGETAAARVARLASVGRWETARRTARTGAAVCTGVTLVFALAVGLFPAWASAPFLAPDTPDDARRLVVEVLRWTAPILVLDALQVYLVLVLRGIRVTVAPMVLSIGAYMSIGLGGGSWLADRLGATGWWIGLCGALVCASVALATVALRAFAHRRPDRSKTSVRTP